MADDENNLKKTVLASQEHQDGKSTVAKWGEKYPSKPDSELTPAEKRMRYAAQEGQKHISHAFDRMMGRGKETEQHGLHKIVIGAAEAAAGAHLAALGAKKHSHITDGTSNTILAQHRGDRDVPAKGEVTHDTTHQATNIQQEKQQQK